MRCSKAQLWGLLVVASVDPRLGPEKGTDGGKLVKVESRQLGGIDDYNAEALGGFWGEMATEAESPDSSQAVAGKDHFVCGS
jgi:hypothetical protein